MKNEKIYWLWLSHRCGRGSQSAVSLIRQFGDAETVYRELDGDFSSLGFRIPKGVQTKLSDKNLDEEEEILRWCDSNGVTVLVPTDERYPASMLTLRDAPMALYAVGDTERLNSDFHCAVVGTRTMTEYGKSCAYSLGHDLALGGATLVSGLALGVDGMAMAGALDAHGRCVAVLGCGIDVIYPKEHENLLRKVLETGTVITEYAPGMSPCGAHFPVRNRIISGISAAVCVVEGNMRSGSLITARHAIYQGRHLFAVPGKVGDDSSMGTNYLLKEGATPLLSADDVLNEYKFLYPHVLLTSENGQSSLRLSDTGADAAEKELGIGKRGAKKQKRVKDKEEKKTAEKARKKETHTEKAPKRENPFGDIPEKKKPATSLPNLDSLEPNELTVLNYMKDDVPILADELIGCGLTLPQILVSLTMLELAGAVEAGAGGFYLKRGADFQSEPEYITEDDNGM